MILSAACGSLLSTIGNGSPATYPTRLRPSDERRTCEEYFSVVSLYGGGQSMRSVGAILMLIPCITRVYCPGVIMSLTLYTFSSVMKSPGLTCASAGAVAVNIAVTRAAQQAASQNFPKSRIRTRLQCLRSL